MALQRIQFTDNYIPKTNFETVTVDVNIGNAANAAASFAVYSGKQLINVNAPAVLGISPNFIQQITRIRAVIPMIIPHIQWISVTVLITEGNTSSSLGPYKALAEKECSTVIFTLQIHHQ